MAEEQAAKNANAANPQPMAPTPATRDDVVQNGSVGYAAAYVILTGSTQWLGVLPPIPDGLGEPLTAALATLIGCVLFHTRRALGIRKMEKGG